MKKSRWLHLTLVLAAIASRAAAVILLHSHEIPRSTYEHGEIAQNLCLGRGFSMHFLGADGPTAQQAPVYPFLIAIAYLVGGIETPRSLFLIELGQAALGGVLVLGVLRLAGLIAPASRWFACGAGLLVAIHPTLIYAATHVQVALLATTLLVWTLAWAYRTGQSGLIIHSAFTGLLLATLALTDPILSLAAIAMIGAIWQGRRLSVSPVRQTIALTTIVLTVSVIGVAPWIVRSWLVFGEPIAIKSTFGYAFWQGNCALSEGTDKVVRSSIDRVLEGADSMSSLERLNRKLWEARHEAGYLDDVALTKEDYRQLGSVSEPERSRILFRRAVADLTAQPWRYRELCLRRLQYFVFFDETNPKTRVSIYRIPHLALTLLAIAGLVLAKPEIRRRLTPTIATAVALTIFHSLTIVSARFHIPIEPLLALWAGAGLTRFEKPMTLARSSPASHHLKRFGVDERLAVVHRVS